ncbi:methyl-accepting chemotaxis protein [Methanospirillum stamsii]|uniref:Methyl-accepting chemotaxis protein n=1 Tax=Methanospirillum stamsii TaxID=1277351 RepID=A0A2V2ND80_9EURY|nr:methyl-accepting chemotaxis protein [Methanospirillum stamsii]PWR75566.1 hypothetical protein DLD82_04155 [Methanospirillum stamsii]
MNFARMEFTSIKHKILFFGGIALLLVAIGIIGYAAYTLNSTAVISAEEGLQSLAEHESARVSAILDEPYTTSSAVAALLEGVRKTNTNFPRSQVVPMIEGVLADRPLYNGVYTIWEPGVFDGRDEEYKLKDGYDKTGRLRIYWYRDASGSMVRKIYDETSSDPGSYYDVPKKTLKGSVIDPYIETMQGDPVLMASLVTPIIRDGQFNGIVAVDVAIQDIEEIADSLDIYDGNGKLLVVSNGGLIAGATGDLDVAGKPLDEVAPEFNLDPGLITKVISSGETNTFDDGTHLGSIVPISIGDSETPWAVVVFAPKSVVTAEATAQTFTLIVIGLIISLIGMGVLYFVARSIAQPIIHITGVSQAISVGDLETHIGINQKDEIGKLADAFRNMRQGLKDKASSAAEIARGNLDITVPVAGDKDVLGQSMIQMVSSIADVTSTMTRLSDNASVGNLSIRGDSSLFQGEYARIVEGVNSTLDAVMDPLNEGMRLAGEYARNNFKARFNPEVTVQGDFVRFRDAMDEIGIQVSGTLRTITDKMSELTASAEEAQASANEVARGAVEVATNAEAVSHNADRGSDGTSQVLKAMEDLSVVVSDISMKTDQVSRLAAEGNQLSNEGQTLAKKAGEGMEGIKSATSDIGTLINSIKDQMEQITSVIAIITSISDETNLLALNAAIEAARAGEAGRGFAVVADEVKELATESHQSAEKIEQMINTLSRESARATDIMSKAQNEVSEGYTDVLKTLDIFQKIVVMLSDVAQNISEVAAASEEQAASVEEITASINEVHQMIKTTAENAVSNAAISEESSAAVDQIQRVVENVNGVITILQREIDKFTI